MAASWGLAFEYGKNAYEDMWKKQEMNERLAAERKLFDLKLANDIGEQETVNFEQERSRNVRNTINAYQNDIMAGGQRGRQAYVDALNQLGVPTALINGKAVPIKDGKADMSAAVDLTDTSKWTGTAMLSELSKRINTARDESNRYMAEQEKNRTFEWEKEKFAREDQTRRDIANLNARTQIAAAGIYAASRAAGSGGSSSSASGVPGGKITTSFYNKDTTKAASEMAARTEFGEGVTVSEDDAGNLTFAKNGVPFQPEDGKLTNYYNLRNKIIVDSQNRRFYTGQSDYASAFSLGSQYGAKYLEDLTNLQNNLEGIATTKVDLPGANLGLTDPIVTSPSTEVIFKPANSFGLTAPIINRNDVVTNYNTGSINPAIDALAAGLSFNYQN